MFESLGRREKDVAREVLRDYPISALTTVAGLAERSGVSTATVLRLVQRLGLDGYSAFQDAVKTDLDRLLHSPSDRLTALRETGDTDRPFLRRMLERSAGNLTGGYDPVMEADFRQIVDLIADPKRRIYCVGGRYAHHIVGLLADYLGVLRDGVRMVAGQPDAWSRHLLEIDGRSVVVVADIRRYQRTVQRFAALASARGARVVVLSDPWAEPADFAADHLIRLPTASPSLMDSYAALLVFAEAIVGALAERLGPALQDRLAACEALDCVETDLRRAWPGTGKHEQEE
jgi:DNA-binding MurR/RpiR family transcriptional regulator